MGDQNTTKALIPSAFEAEIQAAAKLFETITAYPGASPLPCKALVNSVNRAAGRAIIAVLVGQISSHTVEYMTWKFTDPKKLCKNYFPRFSG